MTTTTTPTGIDALDAETKADIASALWLDRFDPAAVPADTLARIASAKNSNRAFGERMQARLRYLLDNPDSFSHDMTARYNALLDAADSLSPHQAYAMTIMLGGDSSKGYERIPADANFQFPRDHAEQLQKQVGWYFFVGSCTGENGKEYGVELMFFRYALLPVPLARQFGLTDEENQVVELQFGIAEAGGRHYQAVPIVIAGTTGLIEYRPNAIHVRMGKNSALPLQAGETFPLRVQARGAYRGETDPVELGVDLTFSSAKGVLKQGADGCSPCCGGVGTLYYSMPGLVLDAGASSLTFKGEQVRLQEGSFWFDHQWATGMIPGGSPRSHVLRAAAVLKSGGVAGWDWFMAQFEGNRQMTFSSLHSPEYQRFYAQTGPTPPGTMTVPIAGKYMDPAGSVTDVKGTLDVTDWTRSVDTPDPAQYAPTYAWYPNRWEFHIGAEALEDIRDFIMTPIVDGGQSGFFAFSGHYSEGAVYLRNARGEEIGRGFAESVLYADTRATMIHLAGLPVTPETMKLLDPPTTPLSTKLKALAYLALPAHKKELETLIKGCMAHGL